MRSKSIKIQGSEVDAVLLCGGKGFKVYSHENMLLLSIGRKLLGLEENDLGYELTMNYVNLKYHNLDKQSEIKEKFQEFIKKIRL